MTDVRCVHCGEAHPPGTRFCPATGQPLPRESAPPLQGQNAQPPPQVHPQAGQGQPPRAQAPYSQPAPGYAQQPPPYGQPAPGYGQQPPPYGQPAPGYGQQPPPYGQPAPGYAQQAPPYAAYGEQAPHAAPGYEARLSQGIGAGKPIGALITEAIALYRKHVSALLVTCAILIVPISLLKSTAMAVVLAPAAVTSVALGNAAELSRHTAEEWQRQYKAAQGDPKKLQQLSQQQAKELQDLGRSLKVTGTAAVGGLMAFLLGFVAMLIGLALMYGIGIPLVTGALTIIVADRATGGNAGPAEAYKLLLKRLGKFFSAWIPAFCIVLLGLCLLVLPGLIASFFFVFVAPVVLLENIGGVAALKRSVALVKANVLQVAVVGLVFAGIRIVASALTSIFVPAGAYFFGSLVQDVLLLFLLPVPIVGSVLLYLDIRRQADGLDYQGVQAGIESLRRS